MKYMTSDQAYAKALASGRGPGDTYEYVNKNKQSIIMILTDTGFKTLPRDRKK